MINGQDVGSFDFNMGPDPGIAWETPFSVMVTTGQEIAYTCEFYF
jgi:hypothetical protein